MAQLDRIAQAAFKKLFGLGHTEVKQFPIGNESDPSALTSLSRDIYAEVIPASASAVAGRIVDCTNASDGTATSRLTLTINPADTAGEGVGYYVTVPSGHGLLSEIDPYTGALFQIGDRVRSIIPKKFGGTWRPVVYATSTEIPPLDTSDWFLDERSGVAYFGSAPGLTPTRLSCYVYVGKTLASPLALSLGGTGASAFTTGSVVFMGASALSQNNASLFWDIANTRLGICTNAPLVELDVNGGFATRATTTAQIAANQNNYAIGPGTFFRLEAINATQNIFGITGGVDGKHLILVNVGIRNIVLANQSTFASDANKILTGTGAAITLAPDESVTLTYDATTLRWRCGAKVFVAPSGTAPADATYVTLSTNATLTNERVLTGTANQVILTDHGAGAALTLSLPQNIHADAFPTFLGMTLTGVTQKLVSTDDVGVLVGTTVVTPLINFHAVSGEADASLQIYNLSTYGSANQIPGANAAGTAWEYKTLMQGANVTIVHGAGTITINSSGTGVTRVEMTVPAFLSVSGSPITSTGTLAVTLSGSALPVANGGTGVTGLTTGSVIFMGPSSLAQDNANFFWDDANNWLGIGTNAPSVRLTIVENSIARSALLITRPMHSSQNASAFALQDQIGQETVGFTTLEGGGGAGGYGSVLLGGKGDSAIRIGEVSGRNNSNGLRVCSLIFQTGTANDRGEIVIVLGAGSGSFSYAQYIGAKGTAFGIAAAPTARVHIGEGTAGASCAPLKFTTGTILSTPEAGAVEYTSDDLFFTISTGTARKRILFADPVGGLTPGRVPFATTNGRLTDSASLAFSGSTLTVNTLALTNPLTVANGGTGAVAFIPCAVIIGGTVNTGPLRPMPDGVGLEGQVLTSSGAGLEPSWQYGAPVDATYVTLSTNATLTNERVLTGTANQVILTDHGAGAALTLSLPQNIHTAATPTFAGLTLTELAGTFQSADDNKVLYVDPNGMLRIQTGIKAGFIYNAPAKAFDVQKVVTGTLLTRSSTPAQITADKDDYDISGLLNGTFLRLSSDASRIISGIIAPVVVDIKDGRHLILANVGSFNLTLANQSAFSQPENRIITGTGGDLVFGPDVLVRLIYDEASARWRCDKTA